MMVVCAGAKSILDLGLTLEYLETKGVPVIGYGTDELPAFYCRESGFGVDYRINTPNELAAAFKAKLDLGIHGGMLVGNPIPKEYAMSKGMADRAIEIAVKKAEENNIRGKELTPFLLTLVKEMTGGMSLDSNIELVYNNRKQDAMELANAFQNQANNYLEAKGVPQYVIEQMTSDVDFQTVRKTLFDIHANRRNFDSTNLLLATSTISHGVDEDSFNIMYFFGMPNNNAEYIQAYSRTGRKYTGIVVDIIRLMRVRDRSYLKNFVIFHQNRDDLVEAVPINRWAKNAIYSTLPGLLSGLIRQHYTITTGTDSLHQAIKVQKLLRSGDIDIDDVISKLINAYGCNNQEIQRSFAVTQGTHYRRKKVVAHHGNQAIGDNKHITASVAEKLLGNVHQLQAVVNRKIRYCHNDEHGN